MVIFSINNNFYIFIGNINKTLGFLFSRVWTVDFVFKQFNFFKFNHFISFLLMKAQCLPSN